MEDSQRQDVRCSIPGAGCCSWKRQFSAWSGQAPRSHAALSDTRRHYPTHPSTSSCRVIWSAGRRPAAILNPSSRIVTRWGSSSRAPKPRFPAQCDIIRHSRRRLRPEVTREWRMAKFLQPGTP